MFRAALLRRGFSSKLAPQSSKKPSQMLFYRHPIATRDAPPIANPTYLTKLCLPGTPVSVMEFKIASDKPLQKLLAEVEQLLGVQDARLWKGEECLPPEAPLSSMFGHVITLKGSCDGAEFSLPLNGGWRVEGGEYRPVDAMSKVTQVTLTLCVFLAAFAIYLEFFSKPSPQHQSAYSRIWEVASDPNMSFREKLQQPLSSPK